MDFTMPDEGLRTREHNRFDFQGRDLAEYW